MALCQFGIYAIVAAVYSETTDIDDPKTAEEFADVGISPQQYEKTMHKLRLWIVATISTRLVIVASIIWIFRLSRRAFFVLATATPFTYFTSLYGGDSHLWASFDVAGFVGLSIALYSGTPQQWSLLE